MDSVNAAVNPSNHQQLYRMYDADGLLLYIGISYSAIARFAQHRADKPWIGDVVRIQIETHEVSRAEILEIERQAIIDERPLHNVVHANGRARCASGSLADNTAPLPFGHEGLPRFKAWHRALRHLGALASELDEYEADGWHVPSRGEFITIVERAARALVYGDRCRGCNQTSYPYHMVGRPFHHECYYACPECESLWMCDWSTRRGAA